MASPRRWAVSGGSHLAAEIFCRGTPLAPRGAANIYNLLRSEREEPVNSEASARSKNAMKMTDDKAIVLLNGLIQIGKDAEQGFQRAADAARNPDLSRIFSDFASQRT